MIDKFIIAKSYHSNTLHYGKVLDKYTKTIVDIGTRSDYSKATPGINSYYIIASSSGKTAHVPTSDVQWVFNSIEEMNDRVEKYKEEAKRESQYH